MAQAELERKAESNRGFSTALSRGLGFWLFSAAVALDAGLSLMLATAKPSTGRLGVFIGENSVCIIMAAIAAFRMRQGRGLVIGTVLLCLVGWILGIGLPLVLLFIGASDYKPPAIIWVCHLFVAVSYVLAWTSVISARRERRNRLARRETAI